MPPRKLPYLFAAVPIDLYGLDLTSQERDLIVAILSHWKPYTPWPFVGVERLAKLTGRHGRKVRETASGLVLKKLLERKHGQHKRIVWDLSKLFQALGIPAENGLYGAASYRPKTASDKVSLTGRKRPPLPAENGNSIPADFGNRSRSTACRSSEQEQDHPSDWRNYSPSAVPRTRTKADGLQATPEERRILDELPFDEYGQMTEAKSDQLCIRAMRDLKIDEDGLPWIEEILDDTLDKDLHNPRGYFVTRCNEMREEKQ